MIGCVCGASVTSAIKSVTLECLLISISVNLKTTTTTIKYKIGSDKGNGYIAVIEITFCNVDCWLHCVHKCKIQIAKPSSQQLNVLCRGKVFVIRALETVQVPMQPTPFVKRFLDPDRQESWEWD